MAKLLIKFKFINIFEKKNEYYYINNLKKLCKKIIYIFINIY